MWKATLLAGRIRLGNRIVIYSFIGALLSGTSFNTVAQVAPAAAQKLTDPVVAGKLGLTVAEVRELRKRLDMSGKELLAMSPMQLQRIVSVEEGEGFDDPAAGLNWRALRMMDEHRRIPAAGLLRALEHRRNMRGNSKLFPSSPAPSQTIADSGAVVSLAAGIQTNGWTWLGPGNVGGRVRALLAHPTSTNIMWCGGVDGGVWKTTNSGTAWFPLGDYMANLAVSCMAIDPANPNVIYAGTGEGTYNGDAIRGAGIFKTTDGGTTWTHLSSTVNSNYLYVNRLAIDPLNGQVLLAATRTGIYRSTNAGSTWTQRSATEMMDIDFHPADSTRAIASGFNFQAFYSTNGGVSWTAATGLPTPPASAATSAAAAPEVVPPPVLLAGRIEVAYSRSSPSTVYASVDNAGGRIYRSTDGGQTYVLRNTGKNFLGVQGWYDNTIWVDPTNPNIIIVGGIDLWRSTNAGTKITKISQWESAPSLSAHADHHVIVHNPAFNGTTVKTVFFGTDGGIYRAANVYTVAVRSGWQELNNNLGITQFYGGAGNSNTAVVVGGTQDNGSLRYTPAGGTDGWNTFFTADGGFAAADQTNPNYFYGEYVYLQLYRATDGGVNAASIFSGITDAGSSNTANFIAPFILDPNNPNTMLAGGVRLWRSTNVKADKPTWTTIKTTNGSPISAIAVAPGNSSVIWVGHNSGDVYYTLNGTAASPTWTRADLGTPNLPNRYCERIAIAPGNSSRVYATFGGFSSSNVWRTSNNGVTWSDITANLPAAPVNSIVIAPNDTNTLYVGTEVGVFGTSDGGGQWSTGNDGPANVSVDELFWLGNKLIAVTHGRGMFSIIPTE